MSDKMTDDEVMKIAEAHIGAPNIFLYTADGERSAITEGEVGSLAGEVLGLRTMVEVATVDYRRMELIVRDTQRRFAEAVAIAREILAEIDNGTGYVPHTDYAAFVARLNTLTSSSDSAPSDAPHRGDAPTSRP